MNDGTLLTLPPTRRELLRLGLGGALGLALWGGAQAEEGRGRTASAVPGGGRAEAVILLWMDGGMSQTDTLDPKPGSRSAGPLRAIRTASEGVLYSELLPRLAARSEALAVIRSMATREGAHDRASYLLRTGYAPSGTVRHPDLGALTAQGLLSPELELPPYVCVGGTPPGAGFLGAGLSPFRVEDPTRPVADLAYPAGTDARRFARRRRLLEAVERRFAREHPGAEALGHREIYERADRLMHARAAQAFDLSPEPHALREAYGLNRFGQGCLMARRLVEAGVRAVEVTLGGWDTHSDNFTRNRLLTAQLDAGLSALLDDLRGRRLLRRTLVVLLTEFGRTPHINDQEGRDHHAMGWSVALGGGAVRGGRVIGATSEDGVRVVERPVPAADLVASIFHALGLDPERENFTRGGRPLRAVDPAGRIVPELFSP